MHRGKYPGLYIAHPAYVLPLVARRDKDDDTRKGYNISSVSDAAINRDVSPRLLRNENMRWLENTRRRNT